ncbi:acyltransferase domain-containing protein, partial [Thermobifida fusca]
MNQHVLAPPVALLLPGQGAQYRRMGAALHGYDRVFTEVMDEFLELLGADGERLRELWLTGEPADGVHDGLNAQPLLFGVAYAAAKSLEHRGLRPAVLLGHSIGELCAATLAGVWDLPAAARILAARSSSLGKAPR